MGGIIYHLPVLNPFSLEYRKLLERFLKQHREYSIIHVHQDCMSSLILRYAKKNQIPIRIAHSHNAMQDKNLKYLVKLFYKKFIPRYGTDLFACSEKAGKWMYGTHAFQLLYNAIDVDNYMFNRKIRDEYRKKLGMTDKFVIGHIGRFNRQKNHKFIISIFKNIVSNNPDATLLLVGTGELQEEIKKHVSNLGIEKQVIFLGVRNDIPSLLTVMDAFLFPSLYEGLPVTLIEAQASGLPCFISDEITDEVVVTDLVKKISIHSSSDEWSTAVNGAESCNRSAYAGIVKKSHYNIQKEAEHLAKFYKKRIEVG